MARVVVEHTGRGLERIGVTLDRIVDDAAPS
jgi:hypothetical protein